MAAFMRYPDTWEELHIYKKLKGITDDKWYPPTYPDLKSFYEGLDAAEEYKRKKEAEKRRIIEKYGSLRNYRIYTLTGKQYFGDIYQPKWYKVSNTENSTATYKKTTKVAKPKVIVNPNQLELF